MKNWKTLLKADPIPWLLEPDNPTVRYFTLVDLLDYAPHDQQVRATRAAIRTSPTVKAICDKQRSDGAWLGPDYYVPRGKATFWRLCLLGELGLTLADDCDLVRRACEYMFQFQGRDGCFRRVRWVKGEKVRERADVPCTHARIVRALIQVGYGDDPRTKRAIAWLVGTQREDGAWLCDRPNARYGCLRATIDYLRAMELFPPMRMNPSTLRATEFVATAIMQPRMGRFHVSDSWTTFEYPYFNYSLIPTLLALLRLGVPPQNAPVKAAVEYVLERQRADGTWCFDVSAPSPADFGKPHQPNKWLTLDALRVIKAASH